MKHDDVRCATCIHAIRLAKCSENEMPTDTSDFVGKCGKSGKLIMLNQKACDGYSSPISKKD